MAFVKVKLDAKEPECAPEDQYDLRIIKVEDRETGPNSKIPGEPYLAVMIRIEDGDYKPIYHNLMIPTSKTKPENVELYKLNIQRFLACFAIPGDADGFDTDDFQGSTGKCLVTLSDNEQTGEPENKLRLPRLS